MEELLATLDRQMAALPEAEQPPPTTLQVLGDATSERAWQQYFVHLLNPDASHGLGDYFLEYFLTGCAERPDLSFSYDRLELDTVQVAQEVSTDQGRPDVVIWADDDWYILLELKVDAEEGADQTDRYTDIDTFQGISLDVEGVNEGTGDAYHLYLAPEETAEPSNDTFIHMSWSWVADQLRSFLTEGRGSYPARTTAQVTDFIDTIQQELTMTDYEQNQQEKMALFVRYREAIAEAQSAFNDAWDEFQDSWGERLAAKLMDVDRVTVSDVPDEYVVLTLDGHDERWIFRQTEGDWAWLFKEGWWRDVDSGDPIYTYDSSRSDARVGFLHRLNKHRDDALMNGELRFFFRSTPPNVDAFDAVFDDAFGEDTSSEIHQALPKRMSLTGGADTLLEGTYPIKYTDDKDFLNAYLDALATAFQENVVDNSELVNAINEQYETAFEEAVVER